MPLSEILNRIQPKWLLATVLALMLASLLQQYMDLNKIRRPEPVGVKKNQQATSQQAQKIPLLSSLAKQNLLGNPKVAPVQTKVEPTDNIPKTKLKLILLGTIVESEGKSSALIQDSKKKVKRYYVGDKLEGGAELHSVAADAVVIQRGTKLETLDYPVGAGVDTSTSAVKKQQGTQENKVTKPAKEQGKLQSLRDRLKSGKK